MRNLKRALSLTLASVMLLGMMVVGSSAAGFPDVDDSHNVEAIEVLQAVDVMVGDDKGNFGPDQQVSRAQMAVVMAKLLNLDYNYYQGQNPFKDVPNWAAPYVAACYANGIVSGYNAETYGANDDVTAVQAASMMMRALGYFQYKEDYEGGFELSTVKKASEIGMFSQVNADAKTPLTRNQVAQMALNALESEMVTFTGTPGTTYTASSGEQLSIGYVAKYEPRTSTELKYKAIEDRSSDVSGDSNHRGQYYIQLGEQLYDGKLTKKYARDDFERPSINWQYDGKEIGTYVDYELLVAGGTYTTGVKGSELYDLLTYSTIRDNDLLTYVDGVATNVKKEELVRSNKNNVNASGTGVLTEVFLDESRDEIIITGINTYLAKANSDYNKTNESLSLKVYTGRNANGGTVSSTTKIVDSAVVAEAADVAKDDYKLVYMSGKESATSLTDYARFEVVRMFETNIVAEASITKWAKSTSTVVGDFIANGSEYKTNVKGFYDGGNVLTDYNEQLLTDMSYNIYEDRYGNAIGVDLAEGTKNYVFITGYDRLGSNISVRTADAAAIFMDGTMDVITVNVQDTNKYIKSSKNGQFEEWQNWDKDAYGYDGRRSENRWYTYTVNNNGVYTLKPVERFFWTNYADLDAGTVSEKVLNTANLFVDDSKTTPSTYVNQGRAYGNDNSVYITVDVDEVDTSVSGRLCAITDVDGVYTGAQNVKLELNKSDKQDLGLSGETNAAYIYSIYDSNYYLIASVVLGEAQGATANYAYILGDAKNERIEYDNSGARADGDPTYYWEFDAVVGGEKTTLTAKTKYAAVFSGLEPYHVQELRYDGEYVVKISDVKPEKVMLENNVAITDKMDVYDVGHVQAAYATGMRTDTGNEPNGNHVNTQYQYSSHRLDGTIELVGRTLYVERGTGRDVGLALTADAKAVLVQYENGKREVTSCGSVSEAVGRLADAETNNNAYPGTQFRGRIVAALESNGAARWVVIISDTPLTTTDKDYNYNYSTTINNVEVRLVNSSTSSVQNRNITATLDRNGNLTVGIPVASNVIGASASRVTATVDGVYRADTNNPVFAIRGSQAQWTLSDYDLTTNNQIVVTIYDFATGTGAVAATITKNDPDNAVVVTPSTGLYVGDTFTLSVKSGYKVTVTGATKNANGTYTITSANVTVTATKDQAPAGSVNVIPVAGSYAIKKGDSPYVKITSAKAGDKIAAVPAEAVEFTAGVTADGDGWYTVTGDVDVTIAAKEGWTFNAVQGFWAGKIGGNIAFVPAGDLYTSLASFALAREAVDPNTQWLKDAMTDTQHTYTVTVNTYVWVGQVQGGSAPGSTGAFVLVPDATTASAGSTATDAFLAAWGSGSGMTVDKSEKVTPAGVYVDISASNVATFTQYVPEGQTLKGALTAAEIEALLKEKTGIDYKVADVATGKATAAGADNITFTNVTPTQVWKITYPGNTQGVLAASSKEVTDVAAGNVWLIPAGKDFAATGSHVVNGKTTLNVVNNKDTNYVAAVELQGTITNGAVDVTTAGTGVVVYVSTGTTPSLAKLATATHKYIRVGAELQFERGASATGIVGLSANGTVVGTTSDTVKTGKFTVTNNTNGTLTLAAAANAVSNDTKVYLDGKEVSYKTANGDKYAVLENVAGYTILYKDANGDYAAAASVDASTAVMGNLEIAVKAIAQGISDDASRIDLYTGYTVTKKTTSPAASGDWTAYKSLKSAQDGVTADEVTVVPANTTVAERTIYVKGFAGELLTMDDASDAAVKEVKELSGRQALKSSEVAAPHSAQFIYEVEVTKNIGASDIMTFGTFTNPASGAVTVKDKSAGDSTAVINKDNAIVGVDDGADTPTAKDWFTFADAKGVLDASKTKVSKIVGKTANDKALLASGNTLAASAFTISEDPGAASVKLVVDITSTAKRSTTQEVYTVTYEINGVKCDVDTTFKAHVLTDVEAAQNVSDVIKSVSGLSSLAGTGSSGKQVAPVVMTPSVAGNTVTLTASPVTITEGAENTNMVNSWYSAGTKDDTVIAIMVTCPDGANGLKATGGADTTPGGKKINLTTNGVKESDGKSLIMPILITKTDLTAKTKTITLTWYTDTSCTDGNEMGDAVTYTFDLTNVTWVPAP